MVLNRVATIVNNTSEAKLEGVNVNQSSYASFEFNKEWVTTTGSLVININVSYFSLTDSQGGTSAYTRCYLRSKDNVYSQREPFNMGALSFSISDAGFKQYILDGGEVYIDFESRSPSGWIIKQAKMTINSVNYSAEITSSDPPTVSNLLQSGTNVDQQITINWISTNQIQYELELYQENVKVGQTVYGQTNKYYTLPANTLTYGKTTRVQIRVGDKYSTWSEWKILNLSLTQTVATITNLLVNGDLWENNIVLSWQSEQQQQFRVEAWKENSKVKEWTGTTAKTFTIAANTLTNGDHTFKVYVAYANRFSNSSSKTINLKDIVPTIGTFAINSTNVDNSILTTWTSTNQSKWKIEVLQAGVIKHTFTSTSSNYETLNYTIAAKSINFSGSATFRLSVCYVGYGAVERWVSKDATQTLTRIEPSVNSFLVVGDLWERDIVFSWQSVNQSKFEITIVKDGLTTKTFTGTTSNRYTMPANTLTGGEYVFRVRVAYTGATGDVWTNYATSNVTLKNIVATASNLLVEGDYWEKPIKVSWQSVNQEQFKVEILKSNEIIKTYTGTTATNYTIAAEQLGEGQYTVKVTVAYANRYVNSIEKIITLKNITPTLSNLSLSGSNIDLDLIFSWQSTDQQKYEVEILKDLESLQKSSGTLATSTLITHNTLTTGLHKFRVRVAYKDRWSEWQEYTVNLTETLPSIGAFEPDGVITERDNPIRVWWTSQNQSKWKLVIDDTTTYTGTTEKEKVLVAGALQTGKHTMVLTITHVTSTSVEKHITKKAEWIVQGKPPIPTITSSNLFTSSRPLFVWDTQDQQGYILEILTDNNIIYSTNWQNGLVTEHKVLEYLPNGSYTVRVKIINQFSLESDYGSKQITINSTENTAITLKTIVFKNYITLSWDNVNNAFNKFYIIRNGEVIARTTETTYNDYTAFKGCTYIIRGVTSVDKYNDSNKAYEECNIYNGLMCTIGALDDTIEVGLSKKEFNFDGNIELSSTQLALNGRQLPVVIFGEHLKHTYNLIFTSKEMFRFLEMCKRREVFLYRDQRQKLFLSISNPTYTIDQLGIEYSVQATEVDYKEGIKYD